MRKQLVSASKFLSLVLRHQPDVIGMKLDDGGWLDIGELIQNANAAGKRLTLEMVHEIVETNDKKRFALSDDGLRIRASQGHSIATVDLNLSPMTPPHPLFHGTVEAFLPSILDRGLVKRSRNHVHLSADRETATKVASRRGKPVILCIDTQSMSRDEIPFYQSDNGVWLVDAVPAHYLSRDVATSD